MKILLTNDDGYMADGLRTLAKRLSATNDVTIVAPSSERSGYAHMVNFFSGISYRRVDVGDGITTYAVDGTPADCVILAVKHILKNERIDAVISGINNVLNIGSDIIYSGTVGAAEEGTFHRIRSIAVSLRAKTGDFDFASQFIVDNLETLLDYAEENVTININIPFEKKERISGVRVAPVVYRPYEESYVCSVEGGREMLYVDGHPDDNAPMDPNGDVPLMRRGYITISPIHMIPNAYDVLEKMKDARFKL